MPQAGVAGKIGPGGRRGGPIALGLHVLFDVDRIRYLCFFLASMRALLVIGVVGAGDLVLAELGAAAPPASDPNSCLNAGHHAASFKDASQILTCARLQSTQYWGRPSGCRRAMQNLVTCLLRLHLAHFFLPNINEGCSR